MNKTTKDTAKLFKAAVLQAQEVIGDVSDYVFIANSAYALEIRRLLLKEGIDVVVIADPAVPFDQVLLVHKSTIEKSGAVQFSPVSFHD